MKVAFLTSGHSSYDDRIYYHLGITLSESGHKVQIISSKAEIKEESGSILVDSFDGGNFTKRVKISAFRERLELFSPDLTICSEPLPVVAAAQYKRKKRKDLIIIYDITEWYPSARFLKEYSPGLKWLGFLKLLFFNVYASYFTDAFIFGESYKSKPYRLFFPFTPFKIITYYPDLKYINYKDPSFSGNKLRVSYSGEISIGKGFGNFLKVIYGLSDLYQELVIEVKIVAWYVSENDIKDCEDLIQYDAENITFSFSGKQNFTDFTDSINDTDIFLDLRVINYENNYSLPVRLFYYAAHGRPVFFSNLKSIRREVEIEKFGYPVNPDDTDTIIKLISGYIQDNKLYLNHCLNARKIAEEKYNWQNIAPEFVKFIGSFQY